MPTERTQTRMDRGSDSAVRDRLKELASECSQADLARRTDTPRSYVSRYLKSTKIPADFCGAVIAGLGVNPSWLMVGEGTQYVADVTAGTASTASNLLELVNAMNAVAQLRLGALVGKEHRHKLRQLSETLDKYDVLKEKLAEQSRPVFKELLQDLDRALRKEKYEAADRIIKATEQVARLCDDLSLTTTFKSQRAHYEFRLGQLDRALQLLRENFHLRLASGSIEHPHSLLDAHNLISTLHATGRIDEAHRVCRSVLALAEKVSGDENYQHLRMISGILDLDLGGIRTGLETMLDAISRLRSALDDPAKPVHNQHFVFGALLLSGGIPLGEAIHHCANAPERVRLLLELPIGPSDQPVFLQACQLYLENPEWTAVAQPLRLLHVKYLKEALEGQGRKAFQEFAQEEAVRAQRKTGTCLERFALESHLAQVAAIAEAEEEGLRAHLKADKTLRELPDDIRPALLSLARHHWNALTLIPKDTRVAARKKMSAEAEGFFAHHFDLGYSLFGLLVRVTDRRAG